MTEAETSFISLKEIDTDLSMVTRKYLHVLDCKHGKPEVETHFCEKSKGNFCYCILYLVNGQLTVTVESKETKAVKGSFVVLTPHTTYQIEQSRRESLEFYVIHFYGYGVPDLLSYLDLDKDTSFFAGISPRCIRIFERISAELKMSLPKYEAIADAYLHQLLALLSRCYVCEGSKNLKISIFKVMEIMDENFSQKYLAEDYARKCNMSVSTFSHKFKSIVGVSPQKYFTNLRMEKARALLINSPYSIYEIASMIGFTNQFHFSKKFKEYSGLSPIDYRKVNALKISVQESKKGSASANSPQPPQA